MPVLLGSILQVRSSSRGFRRLFFPKPIIKSGSHLSQFKGTGAFLKLKCIPMMDHLVSMTSHRCCVLPSSSAMLHSIIDHFQAP